MDSRLSLLSTVVVMAWGMHARYCTAPRQLPDSITHEGPCHALWSLRMYSGLSIAPWAGTLMSYRKRRDADAGRLMMIMIFADGGWG